MRYDVEICKGPSLTLGFVLQEVVDFAGGSVISDDIKALVVHVQNQVLALDPNVIPTNVE